MISDFFNNFFRLYHISNLGIKISIKNWHLQYTTLILYEENSNIYVKIDSQY